MRVLKASRFRSATLAAVATAFFVGTAALAAKPSPSPSASPKASPHVAASPSPSHGAPASPKSASPQVTPSDNSTPATGDGHGDCVSKVAKDPNAKALNKHGKLNHGAAVSKAAHDCAKNAGGTDKPDPTDTPEAADSPDPAETPEAPETPDPADASGD